MSDYPAFISRQVSKSAYYFFDLEPEPAVELRVVCGGLESCMPTYEIKRTDFPYLSMEFVVGGRGFLKLNGRGHKLVPGTMFYYGPGVVHCIATDPDAPLEKYFVDFVGDAAVEILSQGPFSDPEPVYFTRRDSIIGLFEELQVCGSARSIWTERRSALLAESLLLRFVETAPVRARVDSAARASYERCRSYIEEHFLTLRTLGEIGMGCHLDKPYICRLFKRFGRETPYGMLQRLKMDHASELLLNSNLMIKEAAAKVGYDDPYHFSHVFKRVRGLSPSEFMTLARERRTPARDNDVVHP